jgi:exodeoxyribonuclease-5
LKVGLDPIGVAAIFTTKVDVLEANIKKGEEGSLLPRQSCRSENVSDDTSAARGGRTMMGGARWAKAGGEGGGEGLPDTYKVRFGEENFYPMAPPTEEEREQRRLRTFNVTLSPDQDEAYSVIRRWMRGEKVSVGSPKLLKLGGLAGTGKSTLIAQLASDFAHKRIAFVALTGRAVLNMKKKMLAMGLASPTHFYMTLHSLLYQCFTTKGKRVGGSASTATEPEQLGALVGGAEERGKLLWSMKDPEQIGRFDAIFVDEASMVGKTMEKHLLSMGIPVFAVGDHGQLDAVGDVGTLMKRPDLRLEKIHRQAEGSPIIVLAHIVRETGDLPRAPPSGDGGLIQYLAYKDVSQLMKGLIADTAPQDLAMLAWRNATRVLMNQTVRQIKYSYGGAGGGAQGAGCGAQGAGGLGWRSPPQPGDQIVCLKNSYRLAFNGMRGFVKDLQPTRSPNYLEGSVEFAEDNVGYLGTVSNLMFDRAKMPETLDEFEKHNLIIDDWSDLGFMVDYGYCLTVHKAQGSQFDTVAYVREKTGMATKEEFKRHLYTGITRAVRRLFVLV